MPKFFASLRLSVLHNYFDSPINIFSDQYLTKFLNTLVKPYSLNNQIIQV